MENNSQGCDCLFSLTPVNVSNSFVESQCVDCLGSPPFLHVSHLRCKNEPVISCALVTLPPVSGSRHVRSPHSLAAHWFRLDKGPDTDPRTSLYSQRWPLPKDRTEVSGHRQVKSWKGETRQKQHKSAGPLPFCSQITKPPMSLSHFTMRRYLPSLPPK